MKVSSASVYRRTMGSIGCVLSVSLGAFLALRPPAPLPPEKPQLQFEPLPPKPPYSAVEREQFKQKLYRSAPLPPPATAPVSLPPLATGPPGLFRVVALPGKFVACALNNKGDVAGTLDKKRAALWDGDTLRVLPRGSDAEEDSQCAGLCLNDAAVVGGLDIEHGTGAGGDWQSRTVVFWNTARTPAARRVANSLPHGSFGALYGMNTRGQAVGTFGAGYRPEGDERDDPEPDRGLVIDGSSAFCWDGHKTLDLGRGMACGINGRGQVVGSQDGNIVLWEGSEKRVLGDGVGCFINNRGQILASPPSDADLMNGDWDEEAETMPVPLTHATLLYRGASTALSLLPGDAGGAAKSLNDRGEIVGKSDHDTTGEFKKSRAFIWRAGKMYDLNQCISPRSGWVLRDARSINNKGWIVGAGEWHGKIRSFLLIPK